MTSKCGRVVSGTVGSDLMVSSVIIFGGDDSGSSSVNSSLPENLGSPFSVASWGNIFSSTKVTVPGIILLKMEEEPIL